MAEGYTSIHRNIQEHWIWQDPQKLKMVRYPPSSQPQRQ